MRPLRRINLKVGDAVEYIGSKRSRLTRNDELAPGDVGRVIAVREPRPGTGRLLFVDDDGEEVRDEGDDGHAIVQWPRWERTVARIDHQGVTWRKKGP